ncbi:MAG: hypothetical protein IIC89_07625, partial [Chloroflexi bacterium]|nr:hypothetical protein [Chloroflexota bacterium]
LTATATLVGDVPTSTPGTAVTPGPGDTPTPAGPTGVPTPARSPTPGDVTTKVFVDPESQSVWPPAASIDIRVETTGQVSKYGILLTWNPAILRFDSIVEGSFLGSTGLGVDCSYGPGIGRVSIICTTTGEAPAPSGSGVLASVNFFTASERTTPLDLAAVELIDAAGAPLALTVFGGKIIVKAATVTPTPDAVDTPSPAVTLVPTRTPTAASDRTPTPADGPSKVFVDPETQSVGPPEAAVDIRVVAMEQVAAYSFLLTWDPSILQIAGVANGIFLGSTGRSVTCSISSSAGRLNMTCATSGSEPAPTGSGILATVSLLTRGEGTTLMDLDAVGLLSPASVPLALTVTDGSVTVKTSIATPIPTPVATGLPIVTPPIPTPVATGPPIATPPNGGANAQAVLPLRERPGIRRPPLAKRNSAPIIHQVRYV